MHQLDQTQLKMEAWLLAVVQFVKGPQHHLQKTRQVFFRKQDSRACSPGTLISRDFKKCCIFTAQPGHQAIAQIAHKLPGNLRRTVAGVQQRIGFFHHGGALVFADVFKQSLKDRVGNRAHQFTNLFRIKDCFAILNRSTGDRLVHDRERIAHGTVACLSQKRQRCLVRIDLLFDRDPAQLFQNVFKGDCVETEMLTPRSNRLRNVFRLRSRHHEDDVVRRFFERLQQGIEGCIRNLVCFIKDVNLVTIARRPVACGIPQFADLVDTAIGRSINFNDIDRVPGLDLSAGLAGLAGFRCRSLRTSNLASAVQRHRQDTRDRSLADPTVTAEDVAVRDALLCKGIQQGARDMILPGDVREALRPIFAC